MEAVVVLLSVLLLPSAALAQSTRGLTASSTRAIRAGAYVAADGKLVDDGVVVTNGEVIAQVGGEIPTGAVVDNYPGAVLCPGLIDCQAALGASGSLSERQSAIQPAVNARDAFDRFSRQLRAALAAGVTTFALTPDDQNLVGGRIAICQTAGPDGKPRILTDGGPLKLSLSSDAFKVDREPTARIGALGMLRELLEAARAGAASSLPAAVEPKTDPLVAFATGELPGILTVPSGADVLAALQLSADYGLKLVLVHTADARRVATQVGSREGTPARPLGVIVGPFALTTGPRAAVAAGLFERQGVPVAIAGGLPDEPADSLRLGAAVAARSGLTLAAARRAITAVPAELLSVADRVGALQKGRQADVVVFSGDPLDLRSRVLAVYVAGRRVYVGDAESSQGVQE